MDSVEFVVVCYQYILVSLDGCNWEPSCLVRVNFPCQMHFLGEYNIGVFWMLGWGGVGLVLGEVLALVPFPVLIVGLF